MGKKIHADRTRSTTLRLLTLILFGTFQIVAATENGAYKLRNPGTVGHVHEGSQSTEIRPPNLFISDSRARRHPTSNAGSTGGATSTLQKNAGAILGASSITYDGPLVVYGENNHFASNLYTDIQQHHIRKNKSASTTCRTTANSATITLAAAQTFINGVGVTCRGAGSATGLSTPAAPRVLAGQLGVNPGMGNYNFVATTGSMTYSYQLVAGAQGGGYTLPSTPTTITNGPASLGPQSFTISGWTASNNTVTVTTTAAHGLVAGAAVWITDAFLQGGPWTVVTVPTGTTFTFTIASDTRNGFPTSGGSGSTLTYYNAIQITAPVVAGVFQYFVYGGSAGAGKLLHPMLPQSNNTNLAVDPLNNVLEDLGSAMMSLPTLPARIPKTVPSSAAANDLVTTIVSGGGTTGLTVANAAGTEVSGQAFVEDDAANLITAAHAASNAFMLQVPAGVNLTINSVVDLSNTTWQIEQGGPVILNDTLIGGHITWVGNPQIANIGTGPNFAFQGLPTIFANGYPSIWFGPNSNSGWNFSNVNFQGSQNSNIFLIDEGGIPVGSFSNASFASTSTNDCISRHFAYRNSPAGGTFLRFSNVADSPGTCTVTSYAPVIISTDATGIWDIKNFFGNRRGIYIGGTFQGVIDSFYVQGSLMPDITLGVSRFGVGNTYLALRNSIQDTSAWPLIQYTQHRSGSILLEGSAGTGLGTPAVTGPGSVLAVHCKGSKADASGSFSSGQDTCGPNIDSFIQSYQLLMDGLRFTQPTTQAVEYRNAHTIISPISEIAATVAPMPAPVLSVTRGGTVSIGDHYVQIAPMFPVGNGGLSQGPLSQRSNTVNVMRGNQTLTFPIKPVLGAIGYDLYDNGFRVVCRGAFSSGAPATISWNGSPARCGQSAPSGTGGGSTSLTTAAVTSPSFVVTSSSGFVETITAGATANRAVVLPDANGTVTLTVASGTATMATSPIASGACGNKVTVEATNVATTDSISWSYNRAPGANPALLVVSSWPTAGNVNFQYCNPTAGSITPAAATLNWRVLR